MTVLGRFGSKRWPRWLPSVLVVLLLLGLGSAGFLWWRSARNPVAGLPGVPWSDSSAGGGMRYEASFSGLAQPLGVAVSPDGQRVYVTNSGGERNISVFDASGASLGAFAPPDTTPSTRVPAYVAVNSQGLVFVSDREQGKIFVFEADGSPRGTFPAVPPADWHPLGLTVDARDDVYVTDATPGKHRVLAFDAEGNLKLEFGTQGTAPGQFSFPNALAVDDTGRIYVSDSNNGRIEMFAPDGSYQGEEGDGVPAGLLMPRGLALDGLGDLYVVDVLHHVVSTFRITAGGLAYVESFGGEGSGAGQFSYPNGIARDGQGKLYVTDRENGRVQVWGYAQ